MNATTSFQKNWCGIFGLVILFGFAGTPMNPCHAEQPPDPAQLLAQVRMDERSQHRTFKAKLRRAGDEIPFRLVLNGEQIRYEFTNPDETVVLELGDSNSRIQKVTNGKVRLIRTARLAEPVRGTGITYEDIALRFLYWKNAGLLGEDNLGVIRYYKIGLKPDAGHPSQYSSVIAWVGKGGEGLGKAECFEGDGRLSARFKVVSARHLKDGSWFLRQMRIERMSGAVPRDADPTYLDLLDEE